jgi:hypothetical protein
MSQQVKRRDATMWMHALAWWFCGVAFTSSYSHASDTAAPAAPGNGGSNADPITIPLGPLKFTAGPQSDGTFGAALKGGATDQLAVLVPPPCNDPKLEVASCNQVIAAINFDVDAAWSSNITGTTASNTTPSGGNKNNATITLDPSFYWLLGSKDLRLTPEQKEQDEECAKARAAHPEIPLPTACLPLLTRPAPFHHSFVLAAYPDLEYRYGTFDVSGANYTANQFVYGGGIRALIPTQINGAFANWPYVSVAYTDAKNYGASNLPISNPSQNRYIAIDERVELNIDWFRKSHGIGVLALVDMTESRPTGSIVGSSSSWQNAKLFQLIVDTGSKTGLKPAVTYRTGKDRGLIYDRQVIFGVLWDIWDSKK